MAPMNMTKCVASQFTRFGILVFVFLTNVTVVVGKPALAAPKPNPDELLQAKNYVLAACLINRYPNTPLASEAQAWAGGLVEFGNLPAAAYVTMAKLVQTAPPPGMAQQGLIMKLQNCVDFSNSKAVLTQLEKIVLRH